MRPALLRQPLLRLLAINLAIGVGVAFLMLGGLLLLNPGGLRDLIFADGSAGLIVLLFGFIVTFGSTAMGSAIMALGRQPPRDFDEGGNGGGKGGNTRGDIRGDLHSDMRGDLREPAPVRVAVGRQD